MFTVSRIKLRFKGIIISTAVESIVQYVTDGEHYCQHSVGSTANPYFWCGACRLISSIRILQETCMAVSLLGFNPMFIVDNSMRGK